MKFAETFCSQCGQAFGPGDSGFSHCSDHIGIISLEQQAARIDQDDRVIAGLNAQLTAEISATNSFAKMLDEKAARIERLEEALREIIPVAQGLVEPTYDERGVIHRASVALADTAPHAKDAAS